MFICSAQCERPAVGENMILIDESGHQTFPDESSVNVKCSTGYIPVRASASRSITCTGTQWSGLELECKSNLSTTIFLDWALICASFELLVCQNGKNIISWFSITFLWMLYFYFPSKSKIQENVCVYCMCIFYPEKSCGHPGEIHNGKYLFPEGILFGATVTAQCNEG